MGFAEALSDDGIAHRARFTPLARRHLRLDDDGRRARPHPALSRAQFLAERLLDRDQVASVIVLIELWVIAYIRSRYMDTPFLQAVFQIVLGGLIVLGAGIAIGGA